MLQPKRLVGFGDEALLMYSSGVKGGFGVDEADDAGDAGDVEVAGVADDADAGDGAAEFLLALLFTTWQPAQFKRLNI